MIPPPTALEDALGYRFRDPSLLKTAFRHASLAGPGEGGESNERLEFLGDALLNFLVARELYARYPAFGEGELTRNRAAVINNRELCRVGRELGVPAFLETHDSVRGKGGGVSRKMVADAVEALFAALWLDGGEEAALAFLRSRFLSAFTPEGPGAGFDAKTRLQEICQREHVPLPSYETVSRTGPDHAPSYTVRASVPLNGGLSAEGTGKSRKEAEGEGAARLLRILETRNTEKP